MSHRNFEEVDLYDPVYEYFTQRGFTVRSEVKNCDVAAVKDGQLVIIELKKYCTVDLLVQGIDRQKASPMVYIALPRPKVSLRSSKWQGIFRLLKRLELGLIFVNMDIKKPYMEIVFHPSVGKGKNGSKMMKSIIKEIEGRYIDVNKGGSSRKEIMTAYRENAIFIACCLEKKGVLSPADLRKIGTGKKTYSILYNNYYGWFHRVDRGKYSLTPTGKLALDEYPQISNYYRGKL